jgi:non-ribosomal peptide synthase protein (TIGR01720 family)
MPDENQMLFLVANHLCVDLVSWRIIFQDLQEILESGSLSCDKPLSFQVWNTLQAEHIKHEDDRNRPPYRILPADLRYWGMEGRHNTYSDVVHETFMLGEDITTSAMGHCHNALQTQPIDLFLSAVLHSFRRVFVHRHVPDLFNEGHGREPWESDIDLSRTVGWFTTICPLQVQLGSGECGVDGDGYLEVLHAKRSSIADDVVDTLRRTKDARRFRTAEGWFQFAGSDVPMEILFNYLGGIQQLQRDDSLFQHTDLLPDGPESMTAGDMGPDTTRFALFEISAMVTEGRLQFSFMYNRHMRHSQQIRQWISECKWTLEETIISLRRCPPEPTLSDYPLLPITYDGLRRLLKESFPKAGIAHRDQVEDIYPCSPVQEGILLRQLRDPNLYLFHAIFEIKHANPGFAVNVQRLREAWQKVVNRHAVLRTVFVDSICKGGAFDQIVFKKVESGIIQVECDDSDAFMELNSIKIREKNANRTPRLPHQVTFCTTSTGRLLIKMEIDHAVIDGMSTPVLLRDLASAYHGRLSEGNGPLYSDYIRYIGSQPATADITFWKEYLQGIQPCHFPRLKQNPLEERQQGHLKMEFNLWPELQKLCESQSITLAAVLQAAWALILRSYTSSDDVCFGYLSAGRDAPVNEIQDAVGVFINMLCCRVQFKPAQLLKEVPEKVRDEYFRSIRHQQCSLAEIQHELGLQGKALFNTALSIQNHSRSSMSEEGSLVFEPQMVYDPSEVSEKSAFLSSQQH